MLNYAQTPDASTTVPCIPCSERTEAQPDWTTDELGNLLYQGQPGEIHLPGMMWRYYDAAFVQGFYCGRTLLLARGDGNWYVLTDQEFSALIAEHLPQDLPAVARDRWKQGLIFGWCMTWHHQFFLEDEAEAYHEALTSSTSSRRRKGTHAPVPRYPNALRMCIKRAGYTFRELSEETRIAERTLCAWASGQYIIPHRYRSLLARLLCCEVEDLAPKHLTVTAL